MPSHRLCRIPCVRRAVTVRHANNRAHHGGEIGPLGTPQERVPLCRYERRHWCVDARYSAERHRRLGACRIPQNTFARQSR